MNKLIHKILAGLLALLLCLSPCEAAITLLNHTALAASPVTSNNTGASLIVVCDYGDQGGGAGTISDTDANTWTRVTDDRAGGVQVQLWYSIPTTITSSDSISHSSISQNLAVATFSGTAASSVTDGVGTHNSGGPITSIAPGSITPAQATNMLVACFGGDAANSGLSVSGSFTNIDVQGSNYSFDYKITGSATNPTYSWSSNMAAVVGMQSFVAASGGSSSNGPFGIILNGTP